MKARGRLLVLVCALTALWALPGSAVAKPGYYVSKPSFFVSLDLKGSHGYSIHVFGVSRNQVWIVASKGTSSASYLGRGRVTPEAVEGRFGSRGRVSVRLAPGADIEVQENESGCRGRPGVSREGRFIGVIRFRGERDFTSVRAESASGFAFRNYRLVCKRPREDAGPPEKEPPTFSLSAVPNSYPRAPWFSVFKQEPVRSSRVFSSLEEAQYTALMTEERPKLGIVRSASASAPPETFAVSPLGTAPVTATVAPPAPFSGTATYEKSPAGQTSWSGDLAVELPGLGEVSLADPTYRAKLCRNFGCACPIGECFFVSVGAVESSLARLHRTAARVLP